MIIKLAVYIRNLGDGSCSVKFFNTEDEAEKFASKDNERNCDDVYTISIEVDANGKLIKTDRLS
jgi:hypothetical protein